MSSKRIVSDQEARDIGYAMGVIAGAAELMLEGKLLNDEGEKRLNKANKIIEKYGVTDKELLIYFNEFVKEKGESVKDLFKNMGVIQ